MNFDPEYQGENESSLEIIKYPINITGFRCYDDLFNRDSDAFIEVSRAEYGGNKVWVCLVVIIVLLSVLRVCQSTLEKGQQ